MSSSKNKSSRPREETEDELFAMFIHQQFVDLKVYEESTMTVPQFPTGYQVYDPVIDSLLPQIYPLHVQGKANSSHVVNPVHNIIAPNLFPTPMPHD
jgi:hypothetical protein